jgi:hypothetical protein
MCPRTDCTKKPMPSELRVFSGRPRWCAMTTTQHVIKWSTARAVVGVAAIAAVASRDAGSRAGALAPRPGHRSDARSQRCPWPGTWAYRRGGGRVAGDRRAGSYELLMMVIRSSQAAFDDMSDSRTTADPLQEQAAQVFAEQLAADRVPSIRTIRALLHVGQPRAQRARLSRRRG